MTLAVILRWGGKPPPSNAATTTSASPVRIGTKHVLGPERHTLVRASLPAANNRIRQQHQHTEAAIRRRITELDTNMNNLLRVLEREPDPDGHLYRRARQRMSELDRQYAAAQTELRQHLAATPPEPDDNPALLDHLPHAEIDLNQLAAARLRRFLDAFNVEIHYDIRTGRATFHAQLGADLIDQLAQQIQRAETARSATRSTRTGAGTNETDPPHPAGPKTINTSSLGCAPGKRDRPALRSAASQRL